MTKHYEHLNAEERGFRELVLREMRGKATADDKALLHSSPEIFERWYTTLLDLKRKAQDAIEESKAEAMAFRQECLSAGVNDFTARSRWFKYQADAEAQRVKRTTFIRHIDTRLAAFREMRRQVSIASQEQRLALSNDESVAHLRSVAFLRGRALAIFVLKGRDLSSLADDDLIEIVVSVADVKQARAALIAGPGHDEYNLYQPPHEIEGES